MKRQKMNLWHLQNRYKSYTKMLEEHPEKEELLKRKIAETEKLLAQCSLRVDEYYAKQIEL